jgi:WD40 repeat protein
MITLGIVFFFAAFGFVTASLRADPTGRVTVLHDSPRPVRAQAQIGTSEFRTQNRIERLTFSPDSKAIAAIEVGARFPPTVVLFDVATGRPVKRLNIPDSRSQNASCMAFSPDGHQLLWGESDGHLALWDLRAGRLVYRGKVHAAQISDVAFSPRGHIVASASVDGRATVSGVENLAEPIWTTTIVDPNRKAVADQFLHIAGHVLAFTPTGDELVIGGKKDARVSVWNVADGDLLRTVEFAHGDGRVSLHSRLNCLAMLPNGETFMSAGHELLPREKASLEFGPAEVPVSQVRFWNIKTGQRQSLELGGTDLGYGYAALAPNGKQVVLADVGRLNFWNVQTGQRIRSASVPGWYGSLPVYSPDGRIVAAPVDNAVIIFDAATGEQLQQPAQTPLGPVRLCAWSPTGDRVATVHAFDGICRVWDARNGKLLWMREVAPANTPGELNSYPAMIAFSPDSRRVIILGSKNDRQGSFKSAIVVCDGATGEIQHDVDVAGIISTGVLSHDGKEAYTQEPRGRRGELSRLHMIDLATGRSRLVVPNDPPDEGLGNIVCLATRRDTSRVVVAKSTGELVQVAVDHGRLSPGVPVDWQTPEEKRPGRSTSQLSPFSSNFSADGKTLATVLDDQLFVVDFDAGKVRLQIEPPIREGHRVCLSPTGTIVAVSGTSAVADADREAILLYDVKSGELALQLDPGRNQTSVMSFSPDGSRLLTGFHSGAGVVWDVK